MTGHIGRFTGSPDPDDLQGWREISSGGWSLLALITARLGAAGLNVTEMRILDVLGTQGPSGISEIAASTSMRLSTVSRQVTRLIAAGSVERAPGGSDARHRVVRLTDRGQETLNRYWQTRDALVRKHVVGVLDDDEYRTVADAFKKIGDSI